MNLSHMERRLAIKSLNDDGCFTGYASVFGKLDSQNEVVMPGAFKRSLAKWQTLGRAPAMLWMHDPSQPIGIWIDMREDDNGLVVNGRLALSTQKGREAYELIKMGAVTGLSIGYRVVGSTIDRVRKARVLNDVELFEISLVTFPANDSARIADVKSPRNGKIRKQNNVTSAACVDAEKTRVVVERLNKAARTLKQKTKKEGNRHD